METKKTENIGTLLKSNLHPYLYDKEVVNKKKVAHRTAITSVVSSLEASKDISRNSALFKNVFIPADDKFQKILMNEHGWDVERVSNASVPNPALDTILRTIGEPAFEELAYMKIFATMLEGNEGSRTSHQYFWNPQGEAEEVNSSDVQGSQSTKEGNVDFQLQSDNYDVKTYTATATMSWTEMLEMKSLKAIGSTFNAMLTRTKLIQYNIERAINNNIFNTFFSNVAAEGEDDSGDKYYSRLDDIALTGNDTGDVLFNAITKAAGKLNRTGVFQPRVFAYHPDLLTDLATRYGTNGAISVVKSFTDFMKSIFGGVSFVSTTSMKQGNDTFFALIDNSPENSKVPFNVPFQMQVPFNRLGDTEMKGMARTPGLVSLRSGTAVVVKHS